jgi:molybdopterin molybdotransferase
VRISNALIRPFAILRVLGKGVNCQKRKPLRTPRDDMRAEKQKPCSFQRLDSTIHSMSSELPNYAQAAAKVAAYARKLRQRIQPSIETVALSGASGRVLAQPLVADQDQPPFARSTRDGYACRAAEIVKHKPLPIAGSTHAGHTPSEPLPRAAVWEIMTGAPIPAGADAVVMLEHVEKSGKTISLRPPRVIDAGDNIVAQGAQARRGQQLLPAGATLGVAQIALAASCGYTELELFARPRVAILTTGDELVPIDAAPGPGQIRNSNASMLAELVANTGGEPLVLPTAVDTDQALDKALARALKADMLLISGGVSAGKFDLVESALARLHARFLFTGVRIQPGKPLVFGDLPRSASSSSEEGGKRLPFFGLPGNPISSAVTFLLFGAPVMTALAGSHELRPRFMLAQLARDTDRRGKPGLTRFLPALCDFNISAGQEPRVEAVPWHGSGDLAAFARSNSFLVVPEDEGFLKAGSTVRVLLFW